MPNTPEALAKPFVSFRRRAAGAMLNLATDCLLRRSLRREALKIGLLHEADCLRSDLAVLEEEKRRDAADAVLGGKIGGFIDINLADFKDASLLLRNLLQNRG